MTFMTLLIFLILLISVIALAFVWMTFHALFISSDPYYKYRLVDWLIAKPLHRWLYRPITRYPLAPGQRAVLARLVGNCESSVSWRAKIKHETVEFFVNSAGSIHDITSRVPTSEPVAVDIASLDRLLVQLAQQHCDTLRRLLGDLSDNKLTGEKE